MSYTLLKYEWQVRYLLERAECQKGAEKKVEVEKAVSAAARRLAEDAGSYGRYSFSSLLSLVFLCIQSVCSYTGNCMMESWNRPGTL